MTRKEGAATIAPRSRPTAQLTYDVPHGLAGPPAFWRVTRTDTGETVKATLPSGGTM